MSTVPALNPTGDILDTDLLMITHANGTSEKMTGANFNKRNQIIIASNLTITGAPLHTGNVVRVHFTADIAGANVTSAMVINYNGTNYNVKAPSNGSLKNFTASSVDGAYKYLQAYTTLELLFDGTQFVIIGNPVVISSADYTIYTDGSTKYTTKVKYKDLRAGNIDSLSGDDNSYFYAQPYSSQITEGNPPSGVSSAIIESFKWNNGNYAVQLSFEMNPANRIHARYFTGLAWQAWHELWQIKSSELDIGDVTITSEYNYKELYRTQNAVEIIAVKLTDWSDNSDAFSVIPYGNNAIYLLAKSGFSVKRLKLRVYYRNI